MDIDVNLLIKKAKEVQKNAIVPFSGFHVGAALLTKDGQIYTGCNIEGSSLGVTICAERTAFCKALSEGEREFVAIAVVSDSTETIYPCGICRQFMSDFVGEDFIVYCTDGKGNYETRTFVSLLPNGFIPIGL